MTPNEGAPLTAETFVASLKDAGHHVCMGLGRKAPKGEIGIGKNDGSDVDPTIAEQFKSLPRSHVWIAALASVGLSPGVHRGSELGLGRPLGSEPDGETYEYWLTNLPADFLEEIIGELKERKAYITLL